MVLVVEADADELAGIGDGRVEPHGPRGMGDRLELPRLGGFDHRSQHLLGGDAALEEAAGALGEEGVGDGPGANHAPACEINGAARRQIHHAVLAHEAAEARGVPILGKPDDSHGGSSFIYQGTGTPGCRHARAPPERYSL